jgi:hypothetical protein
MPRGFAGDLIVSDDELYTIRLKERIYGSLLGFCACMALGFIVAVVFSPL